MYGDANQGYAFKKLVASPSEMEYNEAICAKVNRIN